MPRQGEIYWLDDGEPRGSEPGYRRPYVVIQNDRMNESGIGTVLMVPMTSKTHRSGVPGNVLVRASESRLPADSVVVVSQVSTVDRRELTELVGEVAPGTIRRILAGLNLILSPSR
ncbi:MAG: type II toxin-antitoxin system PemK/MazF family toxin [Dehalococcoidia bacterium]